MGKKIYGQVAGTMSTSDEIVKDVTKVIKKVTVGSLEKEESVTLPGLSNKIGENESETGATNEIATPSKFKVCTTTALAKPSAWTKIKNTLFAEIKVELTPHQQKIENEINEFLHKEITWQSFKAFWTQEIKFKF